MQNLLLKITFLSLLLSSQYIHSQYIEKKLFDAVIENNLVLVKKLVAEGANINSVDKNGASVLMWAAYKADLSMVKFLISKKADFRKKGVIYLTIDQQSYYGSLMAIAAGENKPELLKYLIKKKKIPVNDKEYNIETNKEDGWTAFQWACQKGHLEILDILIEKGASMNEKYFLNDFTALTYSIYNRYLETAKFLINKGANLDIGDSNGMTPLHYAVYIGLPEITKLLLESDATIDCLDARGQTPLMLAAYSNQFEVCFYLVNAGANTKLKHSSGLKAEDIAKKGGNKELYFYLAGKKDITLDEIKKLKESGDVNKALSNYSQSEFAKAAIEFERCLPALEKQYGNTDTTYFSKIVLYTALSYQQIANTEKSFKYYELGAKIFKSKDVYLNNTWYYLFAKNLADIYNQNGDYTNAILYYYDANEITKNVYGNESLNYGNSCLDLALAYIKVQQQNKAEKLLEDALLVYQKYNINSGDLYMQIINNLSQIYLKKKKYSKAEPLLIEDRELSAKIEGANNENYAIACINLGHLYQETQNFEKAKPLYIEGLGIEKAILGTENLSYAGTCLKLGSLYFQMEKYDSAEVYYLESKRIEAKHNSKSESYALNCANLGAVYQSLKKYDEAEKLYLEAKKIQKDVLGEEHELHITSCSNLASLYNETNRFVESENLYLYILKMLEKDEEKQLDTYLLTSGLLAEVHKQTGKYEEAEKLNLRIINHYREIGQKLSYSYITVCNNLGELYRVIGNIRKAQEYLLEAKSLQEQTGNVEDENYSSICNNLGLLYYAIGDPGNSFYFLGKALEINEKIFGKESVDYSISCNNLSLAFQSAGYFNSAVQYQLVALNIRKKILGENSSLYATSCNNLGLLYLRFNAFTNALKFFKQAQSIYFKNHGKYHRDYAISTGNIAHSYLQLVDSASNKSEAMEILKKAEQHNIEAKKIRKKLFGNYNAEYVLSCADYAALLQKKRDITDSLNLKNEYFKKAREQLLELNHLINHLSSESAKFMGESERENYIDDEIIPYYDYFHSCFLVDQKENKSLVKGVYNNALNLKGNLMRSGIALRKAVLKSNDSTTLNIYHQLIKHGKELVKLYANLDTGKYVEMIKLEEKVNNYERELAKRSEKFSDLIKSEETKWEDIRNSLSNDEMAIEIINFQYKKYNKNTNKRFYYALLLKKSYDQPKAVFLVEENQLNNLIKREYNESDVNYIKKLYSPQSKYSDSLYRMAFKPIEKYLTGVKTVYLSPAGLLNKIAFDALVCDSNTLLSDKYNLFYTTNTTQLTKKDKLYSKEIKDVALFGGIEFSLSKEEMLKLADKFQVKKRSPKESNGNVQTLLDSLARNVAWNYLPGSLKEAEEIQDVLLNKKVKVKLFKEEKGNEYEFKKLEEDAPSIIHISTHGFYFGNDKKSESYRDMFENEVTFAYSHDPLLRSGFILAGGNTAFQGKEIPEGIEDGVLTAAEISNLNFFNTKLAVLSACQTGLGEVSGNEGVYGLQRSFKMAGVDYLLFSLWEVPDYQTKELMLHFYKYWFKGLEVRDAFKKAQNELKKKYAGKTWAAYTWAAFVLTD